MTGRKFEPKESKSQSAKNTNESIKRKPYSAPEILSVEALEAVAAVCEEGGGFPPPAFGKTICQQAQS